MNHPDAVNESALTAQADDFAHRLRNRRRIQWAAILLLTVSLLLLLGWAAILLLLTVPLLLLLLGLIVVDVDDVDVVTVVDIDRIFHVAVVDIFSSLEIRANYVVIRILLWHFTLLILYHGKSFLMIKNHIIHKH